MEKWRFEQWIVIVATILFILIVGGLIGSTIEKENVKELGSAICKEKFGSTFGYYYEGELYCNEPVKSEQYDGITIIIENSEDD